ncbi:MAG TPA: tetratricopeptide repeat protein [Lysobacter sp.]|nr:tetratricopeptide repeat protein [Lysobacter sp.]
MSPTLVFALLAALLAVLTLAYVLRPLWRQRRLAGGLMIAALMIATGALYALVGTPRALQPAQAQAQPTLAEAIAQLEVEVRRNPQAVEAWRLLGRAYATAGQPARARDAFAAAAAAAPQDANVLVEAAEARAQAAPQLRFDAEAVAMLEKALAIEPAHQRARWFLGIAQRQAGRHAEAARTWEPLLAVVPPQTAARLREQIELARADAGLPPLAPAATPADPGLKVRVSLAGDAPAGATLFVIARQVGGPPMPVAVEKLPATGFPREITLDDADSPMPTQKLSALREVEVLARLSRSGNANRQPDDVETKAVRVSLPAQAPVELTLPAP